MVLGIVLSWLIIAGLFIFINYIWCKNNGLLVNNPERGDIVFYKFPGSNRINHVGLVIEVISANKIKTIDKVKISDLKSK